MSKHIVVSIERKGYRYPKLTIVVHTQATTAAAARRIITDKIMAGYDKRCRGTMREYSSMRIKEYRVVDELGLKRLLAAAKASVTIRRKRAAKKAAATRAKNRQASMMNRLSAYDRVSRGNSATQSRFEIN